MLQASLFGAGAVVLKDVPPYAIVAGIPAKVIRNRFPENIIKALQESEWWNYDDDKLKEMGKHIRNPEFFLQDKK